MAFSDNKARAKAEVTCAHIKPPEYVNERDAENRKKGVNNESHLFIEGLYTLERKKGVTIMVRMRQQCS